MKKRGTDTTRSFGKGKVFTARNDKRSPRSTPRRWIPCLSRGISTETHGPNCCPCARGRASRAASLQLNRSWRQAPGRSSRWNRRTLPARAVGRRPSLPNRWCLRRRPSWRNKNQRGGERRGNVSDRLSDASISMDEAPTE